MGPKGLGSSLHVFGTIPSFPMTTINIRGQEGRLELMRRARDEVSQIRAEQRVAAALKTNVLPSAKYNIRPGDSVMGYSEEERKWKPGLMLLEVQEKQDLVKTGTRMMKPNISRVLPSITDDDERKIMSFLKSLAIFSIGGPPGVLLTEYITVTDPR